MRISKENKPNRKIQKRTNYIGVAYHLQDMSLMTYRLI